MSNVGSLENAALKRKERLLALKNKKQGITTPPENDETQNLELEEKLPKCVGHKCVAP